MICCLIEWGLIITLTLIPGQDNTVASSEMNLRTQIRDE